MKAIVVDASAAASWLLPSQRTVSAEGLLKSFEGHWLAPAIFPIEVSSLLLKRERRRLMNTSEVSEALQLLQEIGVLVEPAETIEDLDPVATLARATAITLYDAFYLNLALQTDADLASRDGSLIGAAEAVGVGVHDLRR